MVDVVNLFNRKGSDIDYHYASRLKGEPAEGVGDIHFHPVEPRSLWVSLVANFSGARGFEGAPIESRFAAFHCRKRGRAV